MQLRKLETFDPVGTIASLERLCVMAWYMYECSCGIVAMADPDAIELPMVSLVFEVGATNFFWTLKITESSLLT